MEIIFQGIPNAAIVFSKRLKKTDRERQLIIPTRVLEQFPIEQGLFEREFPAFDRNGNRWDFILAIRQTGEYEKPFLRPPMWHQFVVKHGLSGDDEHYGVVFYINNDEPRRVQVRGLRRNPYLVLGGQPVWEEA